MGLKVYCSTKCVKYLTKRYMSKRVQFREMCEKVNKKMEKRLEIIRDLRTFSMCARIESIKIIAKAPIVKPDFNLLWFCFWLPYV